MRNEYEQWNCTLCEFWHFFSTAMGLLLALDRVYWNMLDSGALKKKQNDLYWSKQNNWITLVPNVLPKNITYWAALVRLCSWHKVDLKLVATCLSHLITAVDTEFCDKILHWLYVFTATVDNVSKEKNTILQNYHHTFFKCRGILVLWICNSSILSKTMSLVVSWETWHGYSTATACTLPWASTKIIVL